MTLEVVTSTHAPILTGQDLERLAARARRQEVRDAFAARCGQPRYLRSAEPQPVDPFWGRSRLIGLAKARCRLCDGVGWRVVHKHRSTACYCVMRAIFRACFNRYRECQAKSGHISSVSLEYSGGKEGKRSYARKREEFSADFELVARRYLDDTEWRVFDLFFLQDLDWRDCVGRLGLDRGNFFHSVYRMQQRLGRVFAELRPYPLYPLDEYFGGVIQR